MGDLAGDSPNQLDHYRFKQSAVAYEIEFATLVQTIKLSAASRTLAEYAPELSDEIVLVTERNRAVAAIVPLEGVDRDAVRAG